MSIYEDILSLPEFVFHKSERKGKELHIWGSSSLVSGLCTKDMEICTQVLARRERVIRDLSISGMSVYLHMTSRKFKKPSGGSFWEHFSFVRRGASMSKRYEQYLFDCCKGGDIHYVAIQQGLSDDSVSQVFHMHAKKNLRVSTL